MASSIRRNARSVAGSRKRTSGGNTHQTLGDEQLRVPGLLLHHEVGLTQA